ncbi:hypothetical protein C8R43DRAFT_76355 [Mycena crocata]|nr:hypothetical protein C8R43DRAFT_76355 [Mycena crocata]
MSVESSANSVFTSGSTTLRALSNRIKSRLALRRLRFAPKPNVNKSPVLEDEEEEEDSEDEENSYISESSSSSDGTPQPQPAYAKAPPNLVYWNRPRVELLDLPLEIIEHIAVSLRDPKSTSLMDTAAMYISEKSSDFSEARFSLSALSQVSSVLRCAVERILYRHVQLDFTGWKGRKHTGWPAGSLKLLLRTLDERPELQRYIYTAALDYQLSTESEALEKGLEDFLLRAPNLTHLFLSQCPVAFWDFPPKHLIGFATAFAPGILPSLLEQLPALKDLHLRDCHVMALAGALPPHNLQRIRLDSSHETASAHFARVLTICGDSVHDLDVRFIGGLQLRAPLFFADALPHAGGGSICTLRLDNISVLSHLASGYAHLLRELPVLQHLHVSHHAAFAPNAFCMLPTSLLTLTASEYYGLWTPEPAKDDGFVIALASCISMSTKEVARVEAAGQDLQPVVHACKTERLSLEKFDGFRPFVTVFFGTRVPCEKQETQVVEDESDDDGEASFQDIIAAVPQRCP